MTGQIRQLRPNSKKNFWERLRLKLIWPMIWYHRRCDEPDEKPFEISIRSVLLGLVMGISGTAGIMIAITENKTEASKGKKERVQERKNRFERLNAIEAFKSSSCIKSDKKKELMMIERKKPLSSVGKRFTL